jgi:hypothetical protein
MQPRSTPSSSSSGDALLTHCLLSLILRWCAGGFSRFHSQHLTTKGKGVFMVKWAQRILMHKLGVCHMEEHMSAVQLNENTAIFALPLGPELVSTITKPSSWSVRLEVVLIGWRRQLSS